MKAEALNWSISVSAKRPIVSLDFDGVLHMYRGWDGNIPTNKPVEGALEAVKWMLAAGFKLFILSTRAHNNPAGKAGIESWLIQNGFPPIRVTSEKEHADIYVDDRGWRFEGPQSWPVLIAYLKDNPIPGRWGGSGL